MLEQQQQKSDENAAGLFSLNYIPLLVQILTIIFSVNINIM